MKVLEKTIDGKTYTFRLTIGKQMELEKKHNEEAAQIIMAAPNDSAKMIELITASMKHRGNENGDICGEEVYDMLVDAGMVGTVERLKFAAEIGLVSGIIDEKMSGAIIEASKNMVDGIVSELTDPTKTEPPKLAKS